MLSNVIQTHQSRSLSDMRIDRGEGEMALIGFSMGYEE
jgi:hypothetical protein